MIKEITDFIETHIDLIDQNDFINLYIKATTKWRFPDNRNTSLVTEYLLEAGINPLEHMDYIPLCMFWESNIKKVEIPENITFIENDAFYGSALEEIIIPASVEHIGPNALTQCANLRKVTILNPNCQFDEETLASYGQSNVNHITYNGTLNEFKEKFKNINLPRRFILQTTDCSTILENGSL